MTHLDQFREILGEFKDSMRLVNLKLWESEWLTSAEMEKFIKEAEDNASFLAYEKSFALFRKIFKEEKK